MSTAPFACFATLPTSTRSVLPASSISYFLYMSFSFIYSFFFHGQVSPKLLKNSPAFLPACFSVVSGTFSRPQSYILYHMPYYYAIKKGLPFYEFSSSETAAQPLFRSYHACYRQEA